MECIILGPTAEACVHLQWEIENLGPAWRCIPATRADQALLLLASRYAEVTALLPCPETDRFLAEIRARPPLAPPYLLGEGFLAPDGLLSPLSSLPERLDAWKKQGVLPTMCWSCLMEAGRLARGMLQAIGIPPELRAWEFLPEMVALTAVHPPLLADLMHGLYPLIGRNYRLTPAAVERRLRLCVEATWTRGSLAELERFFGSSVDPERGKPTNREFLCRMQERLVLAEQRIRR